VVDNISALGHAEVRDRDFGGFGLHRDGLRDFGPVFQGPYATLLIAKAGVDVIKIAPPHSEALAPTRSAGQEHDLSDRNAKLEQTRELSRKVMAREVISGLKGRRR
jgi:hypothetical protein